MVLNALKFIGLLAAAIALWFFILAPHPFATLGKWYKRYKGQK